MNGTQNPLTRRTRLLGSVVFGVTVALITSLLAWQVIDQSFRPAMGPAPKACKPGVLALVTELEQARQSAASAPRPSEALSDFRRRLAAQSGQLAALRPLCAEAPEALRVIELLERSRYAEELALRTELERVHRLRGELSQAAARLSAQP